MKIFIDLDNTNGVPSVVIAPNLEVAPGSADDGFSATVDTDQIDKLKTELGRVLDEVVPINGCAPLTPERWVDFLR